MAFVKITKDDVSQVLQGIADLAKVDVLVGIPERTSSRKDGDPANSATIGYIQEFGSPAQNIPPRPFLIPGTAAAAPLVAKDFEKAATAALDGNRDRMTINFVRAGSKAASEVKKTIKNTDYTPLSLATIKARARSKKASKGRKGAKKYLKQVEQGGPPEAGLVKPLIDTSQLLNSVTFVVRDKKKV